MNAKSSITVSITPRSGETLITVRYRESDRRYSAMAHCSKCGSSFSSCIVDEDASEEEVNGWHISAADALLFSEQLLEQHVAGACQAKHQVTKESER